MKNKLLTISALLLITAILLCSCQGPATTPVDTQADDSPDVELGGFDDSFGNDISDELYAGYFDANDQTKNNESDASSVIISCISGTDGAYEIKDNTVKFTKLSEDSVYSISGKLKGNIIIDAGDSYKLDIEMHGFSLICDSTNPIMILSGDEVSLTAKKDYENYIYDTREAVGDDSSKFAAAIYSTVDLEIAGKGSLVIVSEYNNGIHTKDDLQIKNLNLKVKCTDNALKGNDSVSLESATATLIATKGDCIKTSNSDISEKGNQKGNISITGGTCVIYAACDGIDAAHDVIVDDESTVLNIYTDKYSNYSEEVTAKSEDVYYIRYTNKNYSYSVKYYNSEDDFVWENASFHSTVTGQRTSYHYYSFPKKAEYSKIKIFVYTSDMTQGQEDTYYLTTDYMSPSVGYDTFALTSKSSSFSYNWTNYTTTANESFGGIGRPGGMGGPGGPMNDGNKDKGDHSTKGIKAANEVLINNGTINIKAYDDAIHAKSSGSLENGKQALGNVNISGGVLNIYSNDDGMHASNELNITGGTITVTNSYEGAEGTSVNISGGSVSINASDDGINSTATSDTGISISGGNIYIYCSGDGIDSNSRSSYTGIAFSGGQTVIISTSGGNSAIDTENGYSYTGGTVLAIMPTNAMVNESTHCQNFQSSATKTSLSLSADGYIRVSVSNANAVTVKMPKSMNAAVIYLGSAEATVQAANSTSADLDTNGVAWG